MPATAIGKPVSPILQPGSIATGLALCLPLHEGGGTVVNDLSGYGNNGTLSGGVTWTAGAFGSCLNFDGSSGHVSFPASTGSWGTAGDQSYGFWYQPNYTIADAVNHGLFHQGVVGNQLQAIKFSDDNLYLGADGGRRASFSAASVLTTGVWVHIAVVFDVSGNLFTVYFNGKLAASIGGIVTLWSDTSSFDLGTCNGAFATASFSALYRCSRALSPAEIASLYADSWQMVRPRRRLLKASGGGVVAPSWRRGFTPRTGTCPGPLATRGL